MKTRKHQCGIQLAASEPVAYRLVSILHYCDWQFDFKILLRPNYFVSMYYLVIYLDRLKGYFSQPLLTFVQEAIESAEAGMVGGELVGM